MTRLETPRLLLRPMEYTDAPRIYNYMQDREIAYNTTLIPYPYPAGAAEAWMQQTWEQASSGNSYTFAVVLKAEGCMIGSMGIGLNENHHRAEIGYWMGKRYWGQGYASEACRRIIQYGFEPLGLNRIQAGYFTRNPASRRVMEKAGMRYEGVLRQYVFKWGEYVDLGYCSILQAEWAAAISG
jgi:[ribosomal protein S5]-alanine N-acetyltransferase